MSRMNQVMQVGDIQTDILYYIEDYAYTYLKKQKGKEKTKYFLYGEKEESENQKKLYIYGIAEKPKMEQTYFKEYYPLGFLKIRNDETYWITLKGQEQKMTGFFVFYAPNQAMQEYLVDHREEDKEDKPLQQAKRQLVGETLPMKETQIPIRKIRKQKKSVSQNNNSFVFPISGIIIAVLVIMVLTSTNGRKKIEIFRQVILQTMSGAAEETTREDLVIEEKNVSEEKGDDAVTEEKKEDAKLTEQKDNAGTIKAEPQEDVDKPRKEEVTQIETEETSVVKDIYEEYVVKDGDTLAAICKEKYGTLTKMKEICTINDIKNADYIAPGQKIYLP